MDKKKIDSKKVAVENFKLEAAMKGISMAEADINFKSFSINELTNLMQGLLQEKQSLENSKILRL